MNFCDFSNWHSTLDQAFNLQPIDRNCLSKNELTLQFIKYPSDFLISIMDKWVSDKQLLTGCN